MSVIHGVVEHEDRSYYIETPQGDKIYTSRWLLLGIGRHKREFQIKVISDQNLNEDEFSEWLKVMEQQEQPVMCAEEAQLLQRQTLELQANFRSLIKPLPPSFFLLPLFLSRLCCGRRLSHRRRWVSDELIALLVWCVDRLKGTRRRT